jgi:hypothetical protein
MRGQYLTVACAICALIIMAMPQQVAATGKPAVTKAVQHDTSAPLRQMALTLKSTGDPNAMREVPNRRVEGLPDRGNPMGPPDPLRQTEARPIPEAALTPGPIINIDGLSDDDGAAIGTGRWVPPDTEGDVGLNYYVQWTNVMFAVYSKTDPTGTPVFGPVAGNSIWAGFGGPCQDTNDGDPIVLYDHIAGRWLMSQFAINSGTQCVAISVTGDPTGAYHRYAFEVTPGGQNDYPKIGLFTDGAGQSAYHLSLRDFIGNDFETSAVALERDVMLAGGASPQAIKFINPCTSGDCVDGMQPPHLEGPAPPAGTHAFYFVAWDDDYEGPNTGSDGYRNYEFYVDWATPASSTWVEKPIIASSSGFDRALCGFFQRACIQQPKGGERLDPFDEATMYRAQYRYHGTHSSLVINHSVDASGSDLAGVRWAEMRQTTPNGAWFIYQEGTYAPDSEHRWMGSIAMDSAGNIALGYSVSSSSTFPSVRYTTRMASDPLGTMPGGEVECVAGTGAQRASGNRWGDYSTMSVDPDDDCTFWYTQEYYETTGSYDYNTRICSFKLANCGVTSGCGDGDCVSGEDCYSCPADCVGQEPSSPSCGNGICEPFDGEDCVSCGADCAGRQSGKPSNKYCCGAGGGTNPVSCSDSRCTSGGFACEQSASAGFCCGNDTCEAGEDSFNCELDCGPCVPGEPGGETTCDDGLDNDCDTLVDCADGDCAGTAGCCVPTASNEKGPRCSDGLDNDCDGLIDGADPDC